jgi:hypothetical protein
MFRFVDSCSTVFLRAVWPRMFDASQLLRQKSTDGKTFLDGAVRYEVYDGTIN